MDASATQNTHPVRIPEPRRAWLPFAVGISVTLLLGAIVALAAGDALRPALDVQVVPVVFDRDSNASASTVAEQSQSRAQAIPTVQAPGWLEADPFYIACSALADGVVESILVLEGDHVEAGEVVAQFVNDDARLALAGAEASLASAQAQLASVDAEQTAAQQEWDNPVERDRAVRATAASLAEAQAELLQLPSLIEAESATLDRMREELERSAQALASGAATDIEVIINRKNTEAQAARLAATQQRRAILQSRVAHFQAEHDAALRHAELRIDERRALDTANARVALLAAEVLKAQSVRDEAALRFSRMTIHAPITGFVQRRLKVPGDKVMLGMDDAHSAHILHLYDPAKLQVRVDIPLAEAAHIRVGQACEVVVDILPDTVFKGEVTRITHEADLQKNTLQAKVRVIDPSPLLRPEMLTRVKFIGTSTPPKSQSPTAEHRSVSLIPLVAIHHRTGDAATVWLVAERRGALGLAQQADVQVLSADESYARVRSALSTGDLLITNIVEPESGQRVRMLETGDQV
jgi:multidrug efflux pump subunit AcrA (membrane-fusion protein)